MKKLTKRNRKHNRKVIFGYQCEPEQRTNYTTTCFFLFRTCTYVVGGCCNP